MKTLQGCVAGDVPLWFGTPILTIPIFIPTLNNQSSSHPDSPSFSEISQFNYSFTDTPLFYHDFIPTNPLRKDTDGDGIEDKEEIDGSAMIDGTTYTLNPTNPTLSDTDLDRMPDKWEIDNSLDPTIFNAYDDADNDELPNIDEYLHGTDPNDWDTDGDRILSFF